MGAWLLRRRIFYNKLKGTRKALLCVDSPVCCISFLASTDRTVISSRDTPSRILFHAHAATAGTRNAPEAGEVYMCLVIHYDRVAGNGYKKYTGSPMPGFDWSWLFLSRRVLFVQARTE